MKKKRRKRSKHPRKVSEMLNQYAGDFISLGVDLEEKKSQLDCVVLAWNLALFDEETRNKHIQYAITYLREKEPDFEESEYEEFENNIKTLIDKKNMLFPNEKKFIVSADIYFADGQFHLTAAFMDSQES